MGMYHSIYGTEKFQGFTLSVERRAEIRTLIGERAERLSYLNCAVLRASIERNLDSDEGPFAIDDRICGEVVELSREDFDDLLRVHLCDWLEQVPRSQEWTYRRDAYRRIRMAGGCGAGVIRAGLRWALGCSLVRPLRSRARDGTGCPSGRLDLWRR